MYEEADTLGDAVKIALDKLAVRLPDISECRHEAHVILWDLAKWQGTRSAREARLIFAEEVAALARAE